MKGGDMEQEGGGRGRRGGSESQSSRENVWGEGGRRGEERKGGELSRGIPPSFSLSRSHVPASQIREFSTLLFYIFIKIYHNLYFDKNN